MPKEDPTSLPEALAIELRKPIEFAGETYRSIILREPTAGEWAQWEDKKGVEADILAVSIVAGIPEPVVRKIGSRDLIQASRFLAGFLA